MNGECACAPHQKAFHVISSWMTRGPVPGDAIRGNYSVSSPDECTRASAAKIARGPRQPVERGGRGVVFAADRAPVLQPVDLRQQRREIDLARARLVAARDVGDLDVGN